MLPEIRVNVGQQVASLFSFRLFYQPSIYFPLHIISQWCVHFFKDMHTRTLYTCTHRGFSTLVEIRMQGAYRSTMPCVASLIQNIHVKQNDYISILMLEFGSQSYTHNCPDVYQPCSIDLTYTNSWHSHVSQPLPNHALYTCVLAILLQISLPKDCTNIVKGYIHLHKHKYTHIQGMTLTPTGPYDDLIQK